MTDTPDVPSNPAHGKNGFIRVTDRQPCPICGHDSWCSYLANGRGVVCMRVESDRPTRNGGWIHSIDGPPPKGPVVTPDTAPAPDLIEKARAFVTAGESGLGAEMIAAFAESRCISVATLRSLRIGWDEKKGTFTLPMLGPVEGGKTGVRGIQRRFPDGTRRTEGRLGLFVPRNQPDGGLAIVCEGLTDTASALELGYAAIGLPSAGTGLELAAAWIRRMKRQRAVVVQDNDDPGERSALKLADRLSLEVPDVRIVAPPARHKDLNDWLAAGATRDDVGDLIDRAEPFEDGGALAATDRLPDQRRSGEGARVAAGDDTGNMPALQAYCEFPTWTLPEVLADFTTEMAEAMGVDTSFVALPTLATVTAAVGTTAELALKRTWEVPAVLWPWSVADSGATKSEPAKRAVRPLQVADVEKAKKYKTALEEFEAKRLKYEASVRDWQRKKEFVRGEPPTKPEPPVAGRHIVSNATIEALVPILVDNPRGLLLYRDELAGLIGAMDRYAQTRGGDLTAYLEMHRAGPITVDRKTGIRTLRVPRAAVSITGTIQPGTLKRLWTPELLESGFWARVLMAWPPRRKAVWNESEPPAEVTNNYTAAITKLLSMKHLDEGEPNTLVMSDRAKRAWVDWHHENSEAVVATEGPLAAALSKLTEVPARLVLVFHLVEWASCGGSVALRASVGPKTVEAAIELGRWWRSETTRIYARLAMTGRDRQDADLVDWVAARPGGEATSGEVHREGPPRFRRMPAQKVAQYLDRLVDGGRLECRDRPPGPRGGRPTAAYAPAATKLYPANGAENGHDVAVKFRSTPQDSPERPPGCRCVDELEQRSDGTVLCRGCGRSTSGREAAS